jgi:cell division transport system permease protein
MQALRYAFDEAGASLWRGFKTAAVATATIAVAFAVLGAFLILTANMQRLFAEWQSAAEFSVYLADSVSAAERAAVEKTLRESAAVAAVETVSKEEALRRFKQNFGALADATAADANPLPASFEVRLRSNADPAAVDALASTAAELPGVADVRYDRQWIQRLMHAVDVVRAGGIALAALLVFAAALTVASVVRLALVARRDELHIMQLVGAPIAYIRGPFIAEGLVALVILWMTFVAVRSRADSWLGGAVDPGSLAFLSLPASLVLLLGGMVVGSLGGLIAASNTREIAD